MRIVVEGIRERDRKVGKEYHVREHKLYFRHERAVESFCSWKLLTIQFETEKKSWF